MLPNKAEIVAMEERKFTSFAKLPVEVRLKIWNEALPGRRYIEIFSKTFYIARAKDEDEAEDEDENGTEDELDLESEIEHESGISEYHSDDAEDELDNSVEEFVPEGPFEFDDQDYADADAKTTTIWYPVCKERIPAMCFVCHEARNEFLRTYKLFKGTAETRGVYCNFRTDALYIGSNYCILDVGIILSGMALEHRNTLTYIAVDEYILQRSWVTIAEDLYGLPAGAELEVAVIDSEYNYREFMGGPNKWTCQVMEKSSQNCEGAISKILSLHPGWKPLFWRVGPYDRSLGPFAGLNPESSICSSEGLLDQ